MELIHILVTAWNAVSPIVLLILLGYGLRRIGFLTEEFVKIGNKLVFHVCLPCMLFINVYDIEGINQIQWDIVLYSCAMVVGICLICLPITVLTTKVPERRGVILQCAFRSNTAIIGISLASALGGGDAIASAAMVSAFTIPIFNVLSVIVLSAFTGKSLRGENNLRSILLNIIKNPLIIGIFLGILCLIVRYAQTQIWQSPVFLLSRDTEFLYIAVRNLSSIASPFALIVLGGQFTFSAVKNLWREIVSGTVCRIILAPLLGIGAAILLSQYSGFLAFDSSAYPAFIALFGSPAAVSSAIMAQQMGSDEQLATQLVVWTSIGSIVTVFLTVCILMAGGYLVI